MNCSLFFAFYRSFQECLGFVVDVQAFLYYMGMVGVLKEVQKLTSEDVVHRLILWVTFQFQC